MLLVNWLLLIFLKEILTNHVKSYANNGMIFDFYTSKKKLKIRSFIGKLKRNFQKKKKLCKQKTSREDQRRNGFATLAVAFRPGQRTRVHHIMPILKVHVLSNSANYM